MGVFVNFLQRVKIGDPDKIPWNDCPMVLFFCNYGFEKRQTIGRPLSDA